MNRLALIIGIVALSAILSIGAARSWTPTHAVSFGEQVPDGMCPAYSAYLRLGHPPIEVVDLVCPAA
jgi:hypothetical protein